MSQRSIALLLLLAGIVIGLLTYQDFSESLKPTPPSILNSHFEHLRANQPELVPFLTSIGKMQLIHRDQRIRSDKLKMALSHSFPQMKDGKYLLEAETISTGPQDPQIIIQFSVFDLSSKNKVAEFSTSVENSWL